MRSTLPKRIAVLSAITAFITSGNLFFTTPLTPSPDTTDVATCQPCHQSIVDSFIKTAHYFDSRPADSTSIKGSFEEGKNIYQYNLFMDVVMRKDGDAYVQSARVNGSETLVAPFDVVIGSGRNGQTYLTWSGNQLLQMPISYYAPTQQWCNSPGFPAYFYFGRVVPPNCLECHTSNSKVLSHEKSEYDPASIVYGITCQRCHPGAAEHADYHSKHPQDTASKFVLNTSHLNRQLRMDACALCHSGFRTAIQKPFTFMAGDSLDKFSKGSAVSFQADTLDVHGNQYGLLAASKCYIKSIDMDCSTCHNVHNNEYKNTRLYTAKCISCHSDFNARHPNTMKKNIVLGENCVDCHMPVLASKQITVNVSRGENPMPDFLHTHFISVYKEASEEFMKSGKK